MTNYNDLTIDSQEFWNYKEYKKLSQQIEDAGDTKGKVLPAEFISYYQSLNPDFWLVYYQAGKYFFNKKEYSKAKTEFEKALTKEITTVPDKEKAGKYLKKTLKKLKVN